MIAALTVGTDGACSGNPGPAGWAWVDEHGNYRAGGYSRGTNQLTELEALRRALHDHRDVSDLTIESDSMYAINTYSSWMFGHARRGWMTSAGKPVSNQETIAGLIAEHEYRHTQGLPPARLVKVKGHAGGKHPLNDLADKYAVAASRRAARGNVDIVQGSEK